MSYDKYDFQIWNMVYGMYQLSTIIVHSSTTVEIVDAWKITVDSISTLVGV